LGIVEDYFKSSGWLLTVLFGKTIGETITKTNNTAIIINITYPIVYKFKL